MISATLNSSRHVVRNFALDQKLFPQQLQAKMTLPKRRWTSTKKETTEPPLKTEWPSSLKDFINGTPILTRPLPYFGRVQIDFGTSMMNFGAITSLTGFAMSDILYLRSLSIMGSLCGIVYNISRVPKQLNAVAWGFIFISVNLTRTIQLLFERREIQFTVEEAEVFYRLFKTHGVEPAVFKRLLEKAEWHTVETGQSIVPDGKPLHKVHILVEGSAVCYEGNTDKRMYTYSAKDNGCIIGATAVVDPSIIGRVYPNRIVAQGDVRVLSFNTKGLTDFFSNENGADVYAALLHMMYVDLIGSLRRHRKEGRVLQCRQTKEAMGEGLYALKGMLVQAVAGGSIVSQDRRRVREYMENHGITNSQFKALLQSDEVGWTETEWNDGSKCRKK
jgi:hypothetical protein